MKLEIVTHCWRYSRVLQYQLSSLVLFRPERVAVVITVFYAREDGPTREVLEFFRRPLESLDNRQLREWPLPRRQVLKRAIGRNLAAKHSNADLVWFTDADYLFRRGCLDGLVDVDLSEPRVYFPRRMRYNKDRPNGDQYTARAVTGPAYRDIDPSDFIEHRPPYAIGGVQIVNGDLARKYGYCPGQRRFQKPAKQDCSEMPHNTSDKAYRREIEEATGLGTKRIDLPGVYRIRQSEYGVVDSLDLTHTGSTSESPPAG